MADQETPKEPPEPSNDDQMADESTGSNFITWRDDSTSSGDSEVSKEKFPFLGSEDEETSISCDPEEQSTGESDQKKKGKEVATSSVGEGFHGRCAVGVHFYSYKDPVKSGNLSGEELKECEEGEGRVKAVMKKWDGFARKGHDELGADKEELDEVVKEISKYYSKSSFVAAAEEVLAQLESKLRLLKEEHARLIAERDLFITYWYKWFDVQLYWLQVDLPMMENENDSLYYSKKLDQLEAESKDLVGKLFGLKPQIEELDPYRVGEEDDLKESTAQTFFLAEDKGGKILDPERELSSKREDLDLLKGEREAKQELEPRVTQPRSELERLYKEYEELERLYEEYEELERLCKEYDELERLHEEYEEMESVISGLMEARENRVEELRKRQMEVQHLGNELKEKSEMIKKMKEEYRKKRAREGTEECKGNE